MPMGIFKRSSGGTCSGCCGTHWDRRHLRCPAGRRRIGEVPGRFFEASLNVPWRGISMRRAVIAIVLVFYCGLLHAAEPALFKPDPKSVQWYGPAYRYPQAGWIVLHVEGQPYERGYQHGRLMAPEIL